MVSPRLCLLCSTRPAPHLLAGPKPGLPVGASSVVPELVVLVPVARWYLSQWYLSQWYLARRYPSWWLGGAQLGGTQRLGQLVQTGCSEAGAWGCRAAWLGLPWALISSAGIQGLGGRVAPPASG